MKWLFFLAGFLVHLIFFSSIFDIYFTSPVVHGMSPYATALPAPAKRLVLFVADGLRADKLFELDSNGQSRAPYLRDIMMTKGAWGVSHTRVPTESRPGHVALIAGFYEDVSAVAKGWKENPVEFDSVFNESVYTWSWGSPDILPMFAKGASGDHVFTQMYPAESEDFAGVDSSQLDTWVFNSVQDFFTLAKENETLLEMVRQQKVVFFMHLLGIDVNGHSHKPYSEEYLKNIGTVDKGIKRMVSLIQDFFDNDGQTAFVMTADHGMTNWGSHGAGHPSETLTPLVAWGAGIRGPRSTAEQDAYHDGFSELWNLSDVTRTDVWQADIAPLMACLIGLSYPLNSVGILPTDYLSSGDEFKAASLHTNALQILAQFEVKMKQKQETTLGPLFVPFDDLTPAKMADQTRKISNLIMQKNYKTAMKEMEALIKSALIGLTYYHNYDRFFLGASIACSFIGWMVYIICVIFKEHTFVVQPRNNMEMQQFNNSSITKLCKIVFLCLTAAVLLLLYIQSLPVTHYIYTLLPVGLWYKVVEKRWVIAEAASYLYKGGHILAILFTAALWLAGLEIIAAGFFYRGMLSVGLVGMALWPLFMTTPAKNKAISIIRYCWMLSCLSLAVFPLLPVVGRQANYGLVVFGGLSGLLLIVCVAKRPEVDFFNTSSFSDKLLFMFQVILLVISIYVVHTTSTSIQLKEGLPLYNQIISWFILGTSFILPMLSSTRMYPRLLTVALSFLPPYLLLSMAHEVLFYLALCCLLVFWIQMENEASCVNKKQLESMDFADEGSILESKRKLIPSDLRCAYIFIFLLLNAFFGTGNIASINSFDPATVYCFVTVFNPFVMGALMLWKNLIPFVLVTCTFNAIHDTLSVPTTSLFLLVVLMSDILGLHFFFLVRDYGSWLEIGTSISHYVIVMSMICFLLILLGVGTAFTKFTLFRKSKTHLQ